MSGQESGGKFDPSRYVRQLRGRGGTSDYLDIKWRLVWLRSEHPDAQITTEHVTITNDMAIFKAFVSIPGGGAASGYGSETARDFGDFIEKAETKALGRALAALGYGTQFAQDFEDETSSSSTESNSDLLRARPLTPRPESVRASPPPASRPTTLAPRTEPIPADTRRPTAVRPVRETEPSARQPEDSPAPPPRPENALIDDDDDGVDELVEETNAPVRPVASPAARTGRAGVQEPLASIPRLSPPQPAPRPAHRPASAPAPVATIDDDQPEIDMANFGWTEFWSWARARGFSDRNALDAAVGRSTKGMTPLEIRKQIQARER